jgi:sugar lactone lactonase YvrE
MLIAQYELEHFIKETQMQLKRTLCKKSLQMIKVFPLVAACLLLMSVFVSAQEDIIDFESDRWALQGAKVVTHLDQKSLMGTAILKDVEFGNGVIEVDVAFEGSRCFAGIMFHIHQGRNFEDFYLRPHKSKFPDALQYTPVANGIGCWQLFNGDGFTALTEIPYNQWIHVKLEVSGTQARVFLDNAESPALVINDLRFGPIKGQIGLKGPNNGLAHFANFKYREDDKLDFDPAPEPIIPPGMLKKWEISQPIKVTGINREVHPDKQDLPEFKWKQIESDPAGLVNIARYAAKMGREPDCVLARTTIVSDRDQIQKLNFGYSDEVSVFLNGKVLYRGNSEFRRRDYHFLGAAGLHDTVFLPLKQGANELLLMVTENFGGWGYLCQLTSPYGEAVYLHDEVVKLWEKVVKLQMPESVCYDRDRDVLYVSNFGGDFISKVGLDGTVQELKWVTGVEKPTGIALYKDKLFAVERKNLTEIDVASAKIVKKYPIPGVMFPNDLAVHPSGDIFVSDSQQHVIYRFKDGEFETWLKGDKITNPNGLFAEKDTLIVGTSADGAFKAVKLADKSVKTLLWLGSGSIMDGVKPDGKGRYLMGDWMGRLYRVSPTGETVELVNSRDAKLNLADFEYIQEKNLLIIPTLVGNKLLAFELARD